jgi:hypothetical protein
MEILPICIKSVDECMWIVVMGSTMKHVCDVKVKHSIVFLVYVQHRRVGWYKGGT